MHWMIKRKWEEIVLNHPNQKVKIKIKIKNTNVNTPPSSPVIVYTIKSEIPWSCIEFKIEPELSC